MPAKKSLLVFPFVVLVMLTGCQSAYYSAMEKVGVHKRDIMVDRVEDAQESQQEAQQQFKSALEQLSELIAFDGGELQSQFEAMNAQYLASEDAADKVTKRIDSIEDVADALFDEWQQELSQYSSDSLRRKSEAKLKETQRHYQRLIKSMRRAESRMFPVLAALKDNTLYLKHNLNAQAVGAIEGEYRSIKQDVALLVKDMNSAIEQSQQFIEALSNQ
jgi:hypothetical protein